MIDLERIQIEAGESVPELQQLLMQVQSIIVSATDFLHSCRKTNWSPDFEAVYWSNCGVASESVVLAVAIMAWVITQQNCHRFTKLPKYVALAMVWTFSVVILTGCILIADTCSDPQNVVHQIVLTQPDPDYTQQVVDYYIKCIP